MHGNSLALFEGRISYGRRLSSMAPQSSTYFRLAAVQHCGEANRNIEIVHIQTMAMVKQMTHQRWNGVHYRR